MKNLTKEINNTQENLEFLFNINKNDKSLLYIVVTTEGNVIRGYCMFDGSKEDFNNLKLLGFNYLDEKHLFGDDVDIRIFSVNRSKYKYIAQQYANNEKMVGISDFETIRAITDLHYDKDFQYSIWRNDIEDHRKKCLSPTDKSILSELKRPTIR